MSEDLEHLNHHIRACIFVFISLFVLTVVTVAVSKLHLPVAAAVTIALCVACVKGTLVATYFMHLISEKKIIYFSLILTFFFFLVLMILPVATESDFIRHMVWNRH